MNKKQWNVLSIVFWILMLVFIYMDSNWNLHCSNSYSLGDDPATALDVTACIKAEVYAPFISLSFVLGLAFSICGVLERKKK